MGSIGDDLGYPLLERDGGGETAKDGRGGKESADLDHREGEEGEEEE